MLSLMGAGPGQRSTVAFPPTTNLRADFDPGNSGTVTIVTGVSALANAYPAGGTADLAQATTTQQPALLSANLNGFDVLRFDGSDDLLAMSSGSETQPQTWYLVVKVNLWNGNHYIIDGRNVLGGAIAMKGSSPQINQNAGADVNTNFDLTIGAWQIVTAVFNGNPSMLRVNKLAAVSSGFTPGTNNPAGVTLGTAGNLNLDNCSQIDVARLLSYGAAHDTTTQNTIIDGLAALYGLSV